MQISEVSNGYAQQNPQKVYGLDERVQLWPYGSSDFIMNQYDWILGLPNSSMWNHLAEKWHSQKNA